MPVCKAAPWPRMMGWRMAAEIALAFGAAAIRHPINLGQGAECKRDFRGSVARTVVDHDGGVTRAPDLAHHPRDDRRFIKGGDHHMNAIRAWKDHDDG